MSSLAQQSRSRTTSCPVSVHKAEQSLSRMMMYPSGMLSHLAAASRSPSRMQTSVQKEKADTVRVDVRNRIKLPRRLLCNMMIQWHDMIKHASLLHDAFPNGQAY
jgi:hypothetical protein